MTMFDLVLLFGAIGLALLMVITISVCIAVCKISEINDMVTRIYSKTCRLDDHTFNILRDLRNIDDSVDYIHDCLAEKECCSDDTEEDDKEESMPDEYIVTIEEVDDEEDELDIHLITPEEYHFANGFSKNELKYYPNSDQVRYYFTDNTYLHMEDIPEYIGEGLVFFGMNTQEPNIVYVRNHILNSDFRIEKVVGNDD